MSPMTNLIVIGSRGAVPITALIDTGFDEYVCLPIRLAVTLGLELIGTQEIELADGTQKDELVFAGSVRFLGRTRKVRISLTQSEEALVGTGLLADCRLTIDFPTERVQITRRGPSRGKQAVS